MFHNNKARVSLATGHISSTTSYKYHPKPLCRDLITYNCRDSLYFMDHQHHRYVPLLKLILYIKRALIIVIDLKFS